VCVCVCVKDFLLPGLIAFLRHVRMRARVCLMGEGGGAGASAVVLPTPQMPG